MRNLIIAGLALSLSAPLAAQKPVAKTAPKAAARAAPTVAMQVASIDPGMTREQVVERLGQPLSSRSYESFTYLLYKNGCEKKCGMNDLVVLDSGKVVDAVFRSVSRKYTGASSSPKMIDADVARKEPKPEPKQEPKKKPA